MSRTRENFEEWATTMDLSVEMDGEEYKDGYTMVCWSAWKGAILKTANDAISDLLVQE